MNHFRRFLRGAAPAVLVLVLAGCVVNPVTGKKEFNIISESMEIEMGKETDASIRQEYGIYDDANLNAYVKTYGDRMAPITHRPTLPYHFAVLDTPVENAFAAPGGYIYVTRGMLALMNDEAAMVSILGHELGHVNARHTARAMSRQLLMLGGVIVASALSEDIAKIAPFAVIGLQVLFLKFSRDDEYQADSLGVEYARRIGYAPGQVVPLFQTFLKMEQASKGPSLPNFLSTHPLTTRRIEEIGKMLQPGDPNLKIARPEYLARVNGMVYGENPRQGFVENNAFYHPDMQFVFQIPQGWKHQNSPKQLILAPENEKAVVFLSAETTAKDLTTYMQGKLAQFQDSQVRELGRTSLRINGLNAFRGLYDIRSKSQEATSEDAPMTVDLRCIRKGGQIFTFMGASAEADFKSYEGAIDQATRSFKTLTDPRYINRKPLRLALVRSRGGSLQSILQAEGMGQKLWKDAALMNGYALEQAVPANSFVKVAR